MAASGPWTGGVCVPVPSGSRRQLPSPSVHVGVNALKFRSQNSSPQSSSFSGVRTHRTSVRRRASPPVTRPVRASQEASTSTLLVQEVEFTWKEGGSEVLLTGDFLKWDKKLGLEKRRDGVFSLKQKLPLGRYSYKFVVDGEWKHSTDSPTVPDGSGGFNNEVIVTVPADVVAAEVSKDLADAPTTQAPPPTTSLDKNITTKKPDKESDSAAKAQGEQKVTTKAKPVPKAAPKKVVAKSLQETMLEDVIPLLTSTLGKEKGLSELDITFEDNQLKTSFANGNTPYCFWAFFPDGTLEGSRGSSFTSHGSPPSTIEPFLIDEKKITPELLVFWIKKRLFAQKILSMN